MTEQHRRNPDAGDRPFHRYALAALKFVGLFLGLAFLVHMSWNMFAPDLFQMEPIRIKQALGLVVFAGAFAAVLRVGGLWQRRHEAS